MFYSNAIVYVLEIQEFKLFCFSKQTFSIQFVKYTVYIFWTASVFIIGLYCKFLPIQNNTREKKKKKRNIRKYVQGFNGSMAVLSSIDFVFGGW